MLPNLIVLILAFVFSSFEGSQNNTDHRPAGTISADEVINRSEKAYEDLKVYLDSGKVITEFYDTPNPHKTAMLFKTAYQSSGDFNFEYYVLGKSNSLFTINRSKMKFDPGGESREKQLLITPSPRHS